MSIGEKIKNLRRAENKSQEDLAFDLGVSRQTVNKWETDKVIPNAENIKMLCSIFGKSADYLLSDETETENEIAANKDLPESKSNKKILIVVSVAIGLLFLLGLLLSVIFGTVAFSTNVGDDIVGTDNVDLTEFVIASVFTGLMLIA